MKILLVRHGETDYNKNRKIQGHSDIELNATGVAQATKAADKILEFNIDLAFSSPLKRVVKTAALMLEHSGNNNFIIEKDDRLIEKHFGDFEGATFDEYFTALENNKGLETIETDAEVFKRTNDFFASKYDSHEDKTILVVCHGALIRIFLRTLGLYPKTNILINNTALNVIDFDGKNFTLEQFNI